MDEKNNPGSENAQIVIFFEAGIKAYRGRKWDETISWFEQLLEIEPENGPSRVFIQRCHEYAQNDPSGNWNGVYDLKTK